MDSSSEQKPPCVCRRVRSKGTPGIRYDSAVDWEVGYISDRDVLVRRDG